MIVFIATKPVRVFFSIDLNTEPTREKRFRLVAVFVFDVDHHTVRVHDATSDKLPTLTHNNVYIEDCRKLA